MRKVYDRRSLAPLGFLFFLFFLVFLGTEDYRRWAVLAPPASLASLAVLVLTPRHEKNVPQQYQLQSYSDIHEALLGKK